MTIDDDRVREEHDEMTPPAEVPTGCSMSMVVEARISSAPRFACCFALQLPLSHVEPLIEAETVAHHIERIRRHPAISGAHCFRRPSAVHYATSDNPPYTLNPGADQVITLAYLPGEAGYSGD